jgi:hypothetical protein
MLVYYRDPRGVCLGGQDAWFPHSNDPEKTMKGELWVGVNQSGWSPVAWIPMRRDPEGCEAKDGVPVLNNTKPDETRTLSIIIQHGEN